MRKRALPFACAYPFVALLGGCDGYSAATPEDPGERMACAVYDPSPVQLPGGEFPMGQTEVYAEEGPVRLTTVNGFWIDRYEVTNGQFAAFVEATNYVTVAEQPVDPAAFGIPAEQVPEELLKPGSAVFDPENQSSQGGSWWKYVAGASWRKPMGPAGPAALPREPVVHLAWPDMVAYADWRGGRIPSEAEWEYAARAGEPNFVDQPEPQTANSWQGAFPFQNLKSDGHAGLAPVGCYEPNRFGLFDMVGNVWEVTADIYAPGHDPEDRIDPKGPSEADVYNSLAPGVFSRVMKGGSYLCAPNYCRRYRPASRQGRDPGMGASNVGFRLVYDAEPIR